MFQFCAHTSASSNSYIVKKGIEMPVIDTKHLFENTVNRDLLVRDLLLPIFTGVPPEAIQYEILQQGLMQNGKILLTLDVWALVNHQLQQLMHVWDGPDIPIYILPIKNGFVKNGVAYQNGICLFVSPRVTIKELHALFSHEYHHMCHRQFIKEPPTLLDSLIMEGLAEHAVEELFGEHALSSWTKLYTMDEVKSYWQTHFVSALQIKGLHNHKPFLFGDELVGLPPWIGYCAGYRIIQSFLEKHGPMNQIELMKMDAFLLTEMAGFI